MSSHHAALANLLNGPVPAVDANDLKRVWSILGNSMAATTSISLDLIVKECDANTDAHALWARMTVLLSLLHEGMLDPWKDQKGLVDQVFEVGAVFPLPNGIAQADFDAFVRALD